MRVPVQMYLDDHAGNYVSLVASRGDFEIIVAKVDKRLFNSRFVCLQFDDGGAGPPVAEPEVLNGPQKVS
jgi:hypothetical protein